MRAARSLALAAVVAAAAVGAGALDAIVSVYPNQVCADEVLTIGLHSGVCTTATPYSPKGGSQIVWCSSDLSRAQLTIYGNSYNCTGTNRTVTLTSTTCLPAWQTSISVLCVDSYTPVPTPVPPATPPPPPNSPLTDVYLAPWGQDSNTGASPAQAVSSFARAVKLASSAFINQLSATIHMAPADYTFNGTVLLDGNNLTLAAYRGSYRGSPTGGPVNLKLTGNLPFNVTGTIAFFYGVLTINGLTIWHEPSLPLLFTTFTNIVQGGVVQLIDTTLLAFPAHKEEEVNGYFAFQVQNGARLAMQNSSLSSLPDTGAVCFYVSNARVDAVLSSVNGFSQTVVAFGSVVSFVLSNVEASPPGGGRGAANVTVTSDFYNNTLEFVLSSAAGLNVSTWPALNVPATTPNVVGLSNSIMSGPTMAEFLSSCFFESVNSTFVGGIRAYAGRDATPASFSIQGGEVLSVLDLDLFAANRSVALVENAFLTGSVEVDCASVASLTVESSVFYDVRMPSVSWFDTCHPSKSCQVTLSKNLCFGSTPQSVCIQSSPQIRRH